MSGTMSAYRGSLDAYYQIEQSDGSFGPVKPAGNLVDFSIIPESEELEVISTANADYGQAADSMIDAKPTKVQYSCNRFDRDGLGVVFMGSVTARTAVSSTVTAEAHTVSMGDMIKLDNEGVSSVVVQDATDTTTYDLGDDYEITDAALGIIKVLEDGDISDADVLHISYTVDEETGYEIAGGTDSSKVIKIWGRGVNRFNNKECLVLIPRMPIKPGGNFSLVGTDAATIQYDGTINVPSDGSAPYTIIVED